MTGNGVRLQHSLELHNFARKQLLDVNSRVKESRNTWFPGWGSPRSMAPPAGQDVHDMPREVLIPSPPELLPQTGRPRSLEWPQAEP